MDEEVLRCEGLELRIGYKPLLSHVTFALNRGRSLALVGPNGMGKTTLLRALAGVARPHEGRVVLMGEEVWPRRSSTKEPRACYLASAPALLLDHGVHGNLEYMCNAYGYNPTWREFDETLTRVGLEGRGKQTVRTLSTGQKRRLTLAFLLILKPGLVFADEPTNGLDVAGVELCLTIFAELQKSLGTAILAASHDAKLVAACDAVVEISTFLPRPGRRQGVRSLG